MQFRNLESLYVFQHLFWQSYTCALDILTVFCETGNMLQREIEDHFVNKTIGGRSPLGNFRQSYSSGLAKLIYSPNQTLTSYKYWWLLCSPGHLSWSQCLKWKWTFCYRTSSWAWHDYRRAFEGRWVWLEPCYMLVPWFTFCFFHFHRKRQKWTSFSHVRLLWLCLHY